MAGYYAEEYHS